MKFIDQLFKAMKCVVCFWISLKYKVWHKGLLHKVKENGINGPLLNLSVGLHSHPKLFADDTSLFSTVYDITENTNELNNDLRKINIWAHQWKMSFNLDTCKQADEAVFSRKNFKIFHPSVTFNNIPVVQVGSLKHLGISLDSKLNFDEDLRNIQSKVNRIIGIIHNLY